jgi:hypothetical protein
MDVKTDDRVLLLTLPPIEEIRALAEQVAQGILVGVVERDATYEARRLLRNHPNVMITAAEADGSVPWRDDFFSVIYAPDLTEPSREILRVLAPGGTAWLAGGPVTRR